MTKEKPPDPPSELIKAKKSKHAFVKIASEYMVGQLGKNALKTTKQARKYMITITEYLLDVCEYIEQQVDELDRLTAELATAHAIEEEHIALINSVTKENEELHITIEEAKKATRQSKKLRDVIKFQNAVIGINKKIQKAVLARTLGMGGDGMLRENLAKLDVLCKKQQKGKNG